jgi:hypothetical protein
LPTGWHAKRDSSRLVSLTELVPRRWAQWM